MAGDGSSGGCDSIVETVLDEGDMKRGKQISWDSWSIYPVSPCCLYLLISCDVKVVLSRTDTKTHRRKGI